MNPGRMNKRVTLQAPEHGKGGMGQAASTWQDVATVWAEVKPAKADEGVASGTERATITHDIRIRYRPGVTAKMRFAMKSRFFELIEPPINEREANAYLLCKCQEVV